MTTVFEMIQSQYAPPKFIPNKSGEIEGDESVGKQYDKIVTIPCEKITQRLNIVNLLAHGQLLYTISTPAQ